LFKARGKAQRSSKGFAESEQGAKKGPHSRKKKNQQTPEIEKNKKLRGGKTVLGNVVRLRSDRSGGALISQEKYPGKKKTHTAGGIGGKEGQTSIQPSGKEHAAFQGKRRDGGGRCRMCCFRPEACLVNRKKSLNLSAMDS